MSDLLVQFVMDHDSGLPEDRVVNTWHFGTDDPGAYADDIVAKLVRFYNVNTAGGHKVSDYLGICLAGTYTAKVYDLADPQPRVPIYTTSGSGLDVSSTQLPSEVAVCLSYHAAYTSGGVPARRRGRVFIGPLGTGASTGNPARPVTAFMTTLAEAATRLKSEVAALSGFTYWGVYSRADGENREVVGGWVDNAFDTQRRRGELATARTLWT